MIKKKPMRKGRLSAMKRWSMSPERDMQGSVKVQWRAHTMSRCTLAGCRPFPGLHSAKVHASGGKRTK